MAEIKKNATDGEGDEISPVKSRILVVDDEMDICELLMDGLSLHGFDCMAVQSPVAALELLEKHSFDLILTDLVMPKMDGIALTNAIKQLDNEALVVVMTGFASIDHAVESMKAGAADFITKPLKLDHVLFIIHRVLEAHRTKKMAHESEYYKRISNLDPLTDIGNFRFLEQILPVEIERHKRHNRKMTLMMIDVDDFKKYNDTYGHQAGDTVLVQVAGLLKNNVRNCDFVIRYGGEEFVVVLPEIGRNRALQVGKRILHSIRSHHYTSPEGLDFGNITITIGMATFPLHAKDQIELIRRADEALYFGKKRGKDCFCIFGSEIELTRF